MPRRQQITKKSPEEMERTTLINTVNTFNTSPTDSDMDLLRIHSTQNRGSNFDLAVEKGLAVKVRVDLTEEQKKRFGHREPIGYRLTIEGMKLAAENPVSLTNEFQWSNNLIRHYVSELTEHFMGESAYQLAEELQRRTRDLWPDEIGESYQLMLKSLEHDVDHRMREVVQLSKVISRDSEDLVKMAGWMTDENKTLHKKSSTADSILRELESMAYRINQEIRDMSRLNTMLRFHDEINEHARKPK
jgi:hypothetical protein